MAKASMDKLNELHGVVATYYSSLLEEALENGEQLSSGNLNAINAFLKNNEITVDIVESAPVQNLKSRIDEMIKEES